MMNVIDRFNQLHIQLPANFCESDKNWIKEMICKLPEHVHQRAIDGYSAVYIEAHTNEPLSYKKENKARRAANIRLMEFVDKFKPVASEQVSKPPVYTGV